MTPATIAAAREAVLARDRAALALREADAALAAVCSLYGAEARVYGWSPAMMRQALVARGFMEGN